MANNNRRRIANILVKPRYQLKYMLMVAVVGIVFTIAIALAFREFVRVNYEVLSEFGAIPAEVLAIYLTELRRFTETALIVSATFLAVLVLWALIITHRSAGPVYHFKRVFDAIAEGRREERIRLRPHDEFQDVAAAFNRMMDGLGAPPAEQDRE